MMGFTNTPPNQPMPIEIPRRIVLFFYRILRATLAIVGGLLLFPLVMSAVCLMMCAAVAHDWLEQQLES